MTVKVSLLMRTLNRGRQLAYILGWCQRFFDETIILDGGSTDDTVQVARDCSCQVHVKPAEYDGAALNNQLLTLARNDWGLILDDDELPDYTFLCNMSRIIDPETRLAHSIASGTIEPGIRCAFGFPRYTLNWDGRVAWPDYQVRLVDRRKVMYFGKIHEFAIRVDGKALEPYDCEILEKYPMIHILRSVEEDKAIHNRWYQIQGVATRE